MFVDKLCKKQNDQYFGNLRRLETDPCNFQPSLCPLGIVPHENDHGKQQDIKKVHKPVQVQQYRVVKKRDHQHQEYAEGKPGNLPVLQRRLGAAYGNDSYDR